jgi:hypothetical protein
MTTSWIYPTSVTQSAEFLEHIEWYSSNGNLNVLSQLDTNHIRTVKNLLHISNATAGDIRQKTWYLFCTGFNFDTLPDTITGLDIQLNVVRGRVVEDVVQLVYQGSLIGDNKVYYSQDIENHINVVPNPMYSGANDYWKTNLTSAILSDPTFGVCLRFQSHPYYPHSEVPVLHTVAMRVNG